MRPNSSPLDVPNTPPCSTRTTNAPASVSTRYMARECPTLRRRESRTAVGRPSWSERNPASAPRRPSSIGQPPAEGTLEDVLGLEVLLELADQDRAERCPRRHGVGIVAVHA